MKGNFFGGLPKIIWCKWHLRKLKIFQVFIKITRVRILRLIVAFRNRVRKLKTFHSRLLLRLHICLYITFYGEQLFRRHTHSMV